MPASDKRTQKHITNVCCNLTKKVAGWADLSDFEKNAVYNTKNKTNYMWKLYSG